MFVASFIQRGGILCLLATGFFYARTLRIHGFVPPCRCLMARLPLCGEGQRERRSRFFISAQQTFSVMSDNKGKCLNGKVIPDSDRPAHDTSTPILPISPYQSRRFFRVLWMLWGISVIFVVFTPRTFFTTIEVVAFLIAAYSAYNATSICNRGYRLSVDCCTSKSVIVLGGTRGGSLFLFYILQFFAHTCQEQ